jgi:hypothetical protein
VQNLSVTVNRVFDCASLSLGSCPPLLRIFFQTVCSIVNVRHSGYGFKSLANFYFLRFLLPGLTSGAHVERSTKDTRSARQRADLRTYVSVSKTMQCIANNTLPDKSTPIGAMASFVESKSNFMESFFFNLITARADDSVTELNALEFAQVSKKTLFIGFYFMCSFL